LFKDAPLINLIPLPDSILPGKGVFTITPSTIIIIDSGINAELESGQFLASKLQDATGYPVRIRTALDEQSMQGNIVLTTRDADHVLGEEGYELTAEESFVQVKAYRPAGLFWGIQTLRQLLPPAVENQIVHRARVEIPAVVIMDYPRFAWRGALLDVARHFFSVQEVKRFIDWMALYKMNRFHIHLTDDQGWRIMIHSWPNLALHGGRTQTGGGQGGYYTQAEYSEIVMYAQKRHIIVIPEIDMPGHTNAALASYAELNCSGKATELYTGIEVGFSSLCTNIDITYKFIDDVVRELSALTPGPYFHIGGDESHSTKREDYIPFINKVQDIVMAHGKKVLGWDDIAISSLKPGVVAQHWSNVKNASMAVGQGAKILMSPAKKAYLDMQYDKSTKLGLHWAGYIEVDSAYIWDPANYIPGIGKENVLGIEAALWTETITNMKEMEYMIFPRLPGYAEIGWTPSSGRNWSEYKVRLGKQAERFKAMGINYYPSVLVPWEATK